MIKIKIDGTTYSFDKEQVEKEIVENGIAKLNETNFDGKKGMFSSLIGSAFMMLGIKKPQEAKDMDNLEFGTRLALHSVLGSLDGQTIELKSNGVEEDGK